ncbi:MAG: nicotinate phosphoribosyltransferase [Phenylobacterium sp.]|nr:nicotinate phosphoribosyltransferase [Phenylobacterium sp.]
MTSAASPLLTDLYQLNMLQAYFEHGIAETAVFEFFVRKLPKRRNFLVAAGLEQVLEFLEGVAFSESDIAWLRRTRRFGDAFLDHLVALRFEGDVHAVAEGTVVFPNEPILRVTAPLPIAQLVETRIINLLHFQTLIASKAARVVLAAQGRRLVDFGLRRAHGAEAGLLAARASYLAGFDGTATVEAARLWGVPLYGTMAHAFVQAFDDEAAAFEAFARARPEGLVLLIDTYDTVAAAGKVVELAPRLARDGIRIAGVRLDSGDLASLAREVRAVLDAGGLDETTIFASGGLDEDEVAALVDAGAPIDGFGVGTSLTTSEDAPALDCAYKLQEYAGLARRKRSTGKATWPGRKQVWRRHGADGRMASDILGLESERRPEPVLLQPVMAAGLRVGSSPSLADVRAHAAQQLALLPEPMRGLDPAPPYLVEVSEPLKALAAEVDRRLAHLETTDAG